MRTRRIGELVVSEVGLGTNNFGRRIDGARVDRVVDACLDEGVTLFDTADSYGDGRSEELLGRAVSSRRDEVVIATKFGSDLNYEPFGGGASRRWIAEAVEGSLRRLGTDYIDLYQLHRPDPDTPIEETLGALHDLVESGKVRAIGCSNFSADQIDEAATAASVSARTPFVCVQNQYSLLRRDPEIGVLEACRRHGMGFLPFFPLHSGLLTGKYREGGRIPDGTRFSTMPPARLERFNSEGDRRLVERLAAYCDARGRTLLQLAFGWLLARAEVSSVIAGATTPEQVTANVAAADWRLASGEMAEVGAILADSA